MMGPVHLIFLLAISIKGILAAASPCNKTFKGNETVNPESIPGNVTKCTFTFSIEETDTLMLVFSSLGSLNKADQIIILAKSQKNISLTSGNGDSVTLVSTSSNTTVTFLRGSTTKPGTFKLANKEVCTQDIDPLSGILTSPVYLPGAERNIVCHYNMINREGQITLLEFADFSLNSSTLTVNGTKVTAKEKRLPNDLLLPANATIILTLSNTTDKAEGFSSVLSPVRSDCSSQNFSIGTTFNYTSISPAMCHLMIDGSVGTLVARVESWQTDLLDVVQFRDGFTQDDSVLFSGSSIQANIYLVSSGSKMSVHLDFVPTSKERNVQILFTSQEQGGRVNIGGNIVYDRIKSGGKDGVFQCTLDVGKRVSLTNFNMTNDGTVEVYDGNLADRNPLFNISYNSVPIPIFMKTNQMTVKAKYVTANYTFTATIGAAQDYDQFVMPELGSYAVNASGPNDNYTYNLIIAALPREDYRGTLQLGLKLCRDDRVTIFEGITTKSDHKVLVELTNVSSYPFIPQLTFSTNKGARIMTALSKCERSKSDDVVLTASYDMKTLDFLCGKTTLSPSGTVTSPYYPLRYPVNLNCKWTFENKTNSFLYISVEKLNITAGNSLKLTGNITDFNFQDNKTFGRDLIFSKNKELMLSFTTELQNSRLDIPGEGFVIKYDSLDCGGSKDANFSESLGGAKKDCRWIISVAKESEWSNNSLHLIDVQLRVTKDYTAGSLIVYNGARMNYAQLNLANLTTSEPLTFKSRFDTIIIQYINVSAKEFMLTVNISKYSCTKWCQNGICQHDDWVCNGQNDCGDNSDEINCSTSPTPKPFPPTPAPKPDKGEVPGFWLAIMLIIGLIIGILLPFIIPAIFRRVKKRRYNRMTDMDNITADDYTPMD